MDLNELAIHVEQHPDDHEKRWRLAKRLYMTWEYKQAQEHLQYLKEHWGTKLNVYRYLAATYYRLGRYDMALVELEDAVALWPDEIPLRQQLARVLEMAGHREDAANAWRDILEVNPDHPLARQSIERLSAPESEESSRGELGLKESDSGIDLSAGLACSKCGAYNEYENEHCWQCNAVLVKTSAGGIEGTPRPEYRPIETAGRAMIALRAFLAGVFVIVGLWLIIDGVQAPPLAEAGPDGNWTVDGALSEILLLPRAVSGGLLLIGWPIALMLALNLFHVPWSSWWNVFSVGCLLGAATHIILWSPANLLPFALAVPAVGSLALMVWAFRAKFGQIVGAWVVQGALSASLAVGCFIAFEGLDPLTQMTEIVRFSTRESSELILPQSRIPVVATLQWQPTGSPWLDQKASQAVIEVNAIDAVLPMTVEVRSSDQTVHHSTIAAMPHWFTLDIAPRSYYMIIVTGPDRAGVSVSVYSVLTPQIT